MNPDEYWAQHTVDDKVYTTVAESEAYRNWLRNEYPMSYELLELGRDYKNRLVLDYGCGTGNDVIEFLRMGAYVIAADISEKAIAQAVSRVRLYGLLDRTNFKHIRNGGPLAIQQNTIDHANCNGVLHHVKDPKAIIDRIYEGLKFGGHATFMVYNRESVYYHLYIAYILRFMTSKECGIGWADGFRPRDSVDHVFANTTDGAQCPISVAYRKEDFMAMLPGRVYYGGAYFTQLDLWPFASRFIHRALTEQRLEQEHKDFLQSLEWRGDRPYLNAMPSGGCAVFYMTKDTR